jgi:2',3'-cyclic-nucleotide 2'-phosphodiesterase (5'-nucleotidase family)
MIDSVDGVIESDYSEVIAQMEPNWSEKGNGIALGDLITEAQREAAHAQIAFMNLHGIRRSIGAGPLTKRDLFEVLPFRNMITVFTLTGKEIRSIVNYYLDKKSPIRIAGLLCNWRKTRAGAEIILIEVDGTPVNDTSTYICAANDYLAGEAQRYLGLELTNVTYLNQTVFGAVEKKLRTLKVVAPDLKKRFIKVD